MWPVNSPDGGRVVAGLRVRLIRGSRSSRVGRLHRPLPLLRVVGPRGRAAVAARVAIHPFVNWGGRLLRGEGSHSLRVPGDIEPRGAVYCGAYINKYVGIVFIEYKVQLLNRSATKTRSIEKKFTVPMKDYDICTVSSLHLEARLALGAPHPPLSESDASSFVSVSVALASLSVSVPPSLVATVRCWRGDRPCQLLFPTPGCGAARGPLGRGARGRHRSRLASPPPAGAAGTRSRVGELRCQYLGATGDPLLRCRVGLISSASSQ